MNRLVSFIILMALLALILFSCTAPKRYCKPPKGSKDYAILGPGFIRDSAHVRTKLVSVKYGMRGYLHTFVSDNNDTIRRHFDCYFKTNEYYLVQL